MSIDLSQFHETFLEESFEGLQVMESSLLNMDEGENDIDIINNIFRAAHSIKGGSSTFGFDNVASFTHLLETLLDEVRSGTRGVTKELVNLLLESVDCVRDMLSAEKNDGKYNQALVVDVQNKLQEVLSGEVSAGSTDAVAEEKTPDACGWRIIFKPNLGMLQTGNDPYRIIRELQSLGPVEVEACLDKLPSLTDISAENCYLSWSIMLHAVVKESDIAEIFEWVEDDCELSILPLHVDKENNMPEQQSVEEKAVEEMLSSTVDAAEDKVEQRTSGGQAADAPKLAAKRKSNAEVGSIRVGIDKVDELINMVGELVITQSMLGQLGEDFSMANIEKLKDGLGQLERNTRELQESVMRIRMLPISFAFNRFPRMIRDLSSKLGKQVELKMSGEQTELDKTVMEKIGDPLVHLVRNSLDHGLEQPDVRKANGKPETGVLHLNAYHKGGSIIIEITDDGAGLDRDKIRSKALQNGMITEDESLPDEKIYDLIFQPGFSTADQVSDVSGRGVGMDVVRRNIRELGGTVDIKSTPGEGSTITIRLPLTLAIMDGQLVRVGNEIYIIPIVSIIESLQVKQEKVNSIVDKAEVYKLRDEYINITRLYQLFGLKPDTEEINNGLLVVVEGDGAKVGLYVDELLAQQQVVIKSLETNYKRVDGVSGATILGDGMVAMILDVPGLIAISQERSGSKVERVA